MLTLLLTRHGHTDRSEPEQYLGQRLAATLTRRGRRDARRLAARLADVPIDRVVSSPLGRAAQTAAILATPHGLPVELDQRLMELDYGAWEGLTLEEIEARFPGEYELYDRDPASHHVGAGENGAEVVERLGRVVDDLLDWSASAGREVTCLMVGHSSTNRLLLALVMGVELNDYRRRFDQNWANLTVLHWPDRASGPRLQLANDQGHSRGLRGVTWA